jgi:lipid II:glycine glycyltransferase (peptidoglycan interpeptide bridge formation enzyme)
VTRVDIDTRPESTTLSSTDDLSCSIEEARDEHWYPIVDLFQDASIFQTIAFCRAKMRDVRLEQVVVRRGPEVVAAALVRVVAVPWLGTSIAYVLWGPMFHRWDDVRDEAALAHALGAIRREYVVRRRWGLRIVPMLTEDDVEWSAPFHARGYRRVTPRVAKRTMVVPLDAPLDQLRKGFDQKWRNCLNSAERNGLTIRQGDDRPLFDLFLEVYREMLSRKQLGEPGDIRSFMAAHAMLPDRYKLRVFVALEDGQPAAGAICSAMGHRGVYLFGATGRRGMKNKASYLLQWQAIQWLRERGCRLYDLHGANAEANPGVYAFKRGLCGKNGREVAMLGYFEAWQGLRGRLLMDVAERANERFKWLKGIYGRYRGFRG